MAIERFTLKKVVKSRSNIFHVQAGQWRDWSFTARQVFNEVYSTMWSNQTKFSHPKAERLSRAHWKTLCWNAAWTAAMAVDDAVGMSTKIIQRIAEESAPTLRRLAQH